MCEFAACRDNSSNSNSVNIFVIGIVVGKLRNSAPLTIFLGKIYWPTINVRKRGGESCLVDILTVAMMASKKTSCSVWNANSRRKDWCGALVVLHRCRHYVLWASTWVNSESILSKWDLLLTTLGVLLIELILCYFWELFRMTQPNKKWTQPFSLCLKKAYYTVAGRSCDTSEIQLYQW